ncbi:MAG TPA: hypothetical protein VM286_00940 [Candidatus Thermoplasmatota archaeon]|nr:hypothetical protein [Candidatus Thermoplasmatota archaeon]
MVVRQQVAGTGLVVTSLGAAWSAVRTDSIDLAILAVALLLVAAGVSSWARLRVLAVVGFAIAVYPTGHRWLLGFETLASDIGPRSFFLLMPLVGVPLSLLSFRNPHPRHLSVACAAGAVAGLWWFVHDLGDVALRLPADAAYLVGFSIAGFALSLRWRELLEPHVETGPEQAS